MFTYILNHEYSHTHFNCIRFDIESIKSEDGQIFISRLNLQIFLNNNRIKIEIRSSNRAVDK